MTLQTPTSPTPRGSQRPFDAILLTAQWMVGLCAMSAFLFFAMPASSAHAEGLCGDDIDLHAQVIIESRYPHAALASTIPSADHTLALTPAQPAPHVRAVLWFLSGMRHWFQPQSPGIIVGELIADLTHPLAEQPAEHVPADSAHTMTDLDNEPLDGGMTCEGGQSCAPLERLLGYDLDDLTADALPSKHAPALAIPHQPPQRGPACSVGEPGCDLPAALLECDSSSPSTHLQWLFLPTRRVTFTASVLLASPVAVEASDAPVPHDHLLLGRRLSGRLDRPPRA